MTEKKKLISFIIFVILFYNVVNCSCPNCLKENDICNSGGTCSGDTKCFYNTTLTSSQTQRCTKYLKEGDNCNPNDKLCIIGTDCLLDENNVYKCLDYSFRSLGEQCKLKSDCKSSLDCINNKCSLPSFYTHCHDIDEYCNFDEYCSCSASSNCSCTKIKTEGSSCTNSRDCLGGLTCNNGICGNPELIELGGSCIGILRCDTNNDCYYNNYCDYNKDLYCSNDICVEFVEPSTKTCNSNFSQCSAYQTCSCSDLTCYQSKLYPPQEIKLIALSQLEKCAYNNKCSVDVNLYSSKSCLSNYCRKEICQRYTSDQKAEESEDCGNEELKISLLHCNIDNNSSSLIKTYQSLTSLFILSYLLFFLL
ncbi:hypothetical protein ACTFIV_009464 [Dictyostelium citrinum]